MSGLRKKLVKGRIVPVLDVLAEFVADQNKKVEIYKLDSHNVFVVELLTWGIGGTEALRAELKDKGWQFHYLYSEDSSYRRPLYSTAVHVALI